MSQKQPTHNWSPEKLALKSKADVQVIRQRALEKSVQELVEMCDNDLAARTPAPKLRASVSGSVHSPNDFVEGYHFVCQRDRGVTNHIKGQFWTGSWVVAEDNAKKSLKYGCYLALHETKSDLSYRQGKVLGYRRAARDMLADKNDGETKIDEGIEFLVEEETAQYLWIGSGAGEKGYKWSGIASSSSQIAIDEEPK